MKPLLLLRLALDFLAVGFFVIALAYDWLGNAVHEIIGTAMFALLISHNIFNRRWYGTIAKPRREARGTIAKTVNLSLLVTMLTLLVTSVIISQTVFSFLPLASSFTVRQIHTLAAYAGLLIVSVHLGLHASLIMGVVRAKLGMTSDRKRTLHLLRIVAAIIAACGVHSLFAVDVGSKLAMEPPMDFGGFQTSTTAFLVHCVAIVGLGASVAHYALKLTEVMRARSSRGQSP